MAFISSPSILNFFPRKGKRSMVCAQYLSPEYINVHFESLAKAGNFGGVFFGEYKDPQNPSSDCDVVVKCPIETEIGRQLYSMEKYTNFKLRQKADNRTRFPTFLGEMIIPPECNLASGFIRLGLVWLRVGNGDTLEDFLTPYQIRQLGSLLGTGAVASPLRRPLTARLILELSLLLRDLQQCGIVHRDVKPANILVVSGDPNAAPFKAIDFGSSCDWDTPFKKGIGLATCDPIYTAPERRLEMFKPAYKFDVYSIGLIALRCALPSLTDSLAMQNFVQNVLRKADFSFLRVCSAVVSGRIQTSQAVKNDFILLSSPGYEDMYACFSAMLTQDPTRRADVRDCLENRFVRSAYPSSIV